MPSSKEHGEEPQTKTDISRGPPGGKGKTPQSFGRQRVPSNARDQRQNDDRPAQVVGRTQRARPQPQQRRGTDLQAKLDKRKARSVCHACGQTCSPPLHASCACNEFHGCWPKRGSSRCHRNCSLIHSCWKNLGSLNCIGLVTEAC